MSKINFSQNRMFIGILLTVTLILVLTLSVNAQESNSDSMLQQETPEVDGEEYGLSQSLQEVEIRDMNPAPERHTIVEEHEAIPEEVDRASILFHFISANTFVPFDDDMTYNYYSAGCMYRTGGSQYTEHTLQLPEGAEIDYLRVYFYDNDSSYNARANLYAYNGSGDVTLIASASSSGTPGQSSEGSGYFSHIVDNQNEALSLSLYYSGATTNALRICGVRIRFQYTGIFGSFLPYVTN
jgi:hypothetical protein